MEFLVLIFNRYRWLVWLLVIALTLVAMEGISRLKFSDELSELLLSANMADEQSQATRDLMDHFGTAEDYCYVIVRAERVLSTEVLGTIDHLRQEISRIPEIAFVATILDLRSQTNVGNILPPLLSARMSQQRIEAVAERVDSHPLTYRTFLSADGRTTLLAIRPKGKQLKQHQLEPLLTQLQAVLDAANAGPKVELSLAGWPVVQRNVVYLLQHDQPIFTGIALLAAAVVGWIMFRNVRDLLIMIVPSIFGVIWSHGLLGLVGKDLDMLNIVMAPLVMVVGFTDSVHMLLHVRREQANGNSAPEAVIKMLRLVGPACVLTSLTTAIGFGALGMVDSPAIRSFGLCCAAGAGFVLVSVVTILPLMCWNRPASITRSAFGTNPSWAAIWLERWVHRHARLISVVGILITAALGYATLYSQIDYRFSENLATTHDAARSMHEIDRQFGGAMTLQAVVHWPEENSLNDPAVEAAVRAAADCIEQHSMTSNTMSIATVADSLPGRTLRASLRWLRNAPPLAVGSLVRAGLHQTLITTRVHDLGSRTLHPQLLDLEAELAEVEKRHRGFRFEVAGLTALSIHRSQSMLGDLTTSLLMAGSTILVIIAILFRSLRWGLLAVIPNILPLAGANALLILVDQPLRFSSLLALTVSLGVVVDDSIHMLWHIRRKMNEGFTLVDAVGDAQREIFSAFSTTTLLLVIGFGVTLFSQMPMIQLFGAIACCALLIAFVADLILLPAMMLVGCGDMRPKESQEKGEHSIDLQGQIPR